MDFVGVSRSGLLQRVGSGWCLSLFTDVGFRWVFSGLGLFKDLDQDVLGFRLFKGCGYFCFVDNTKIANVFAEEKSIRPMD